MNTQVSKLHCSSPLWRRKGVGFFETKVVFLVKALDEGQELAGLEVPQRLNFEQKKKIKSVAPAGKKKGSNS